MPKRSRELTQKEKNEEARRKAKAYGKGLMQKKAGGGAAAAISAAKSKSASSPSRSAARTTKKPASARKSRTPTRQTATSAKKKSKKKQQEEEEQMEEEQASSASEAEEAATSESEEEEPSPPRKARRTARAAATIRSTERSARPSSASTPNRRSRTAAAASTTPVPQQHQPQPAKRTSSSQKKRAPRRNSFPFNSPVPQAPAVMAPQPVGGGGPHMPVEMMMETSQQQQQQQQVHSSPGMGLRHRRSGHHDDTAAAAAGLNVMSVPVAARPAVRPAARESTTSRPRMRVEQPQQQQQIYHDDDDAVVEAQEEAYLVELERQVEQTDTGGWGKKWVLPIFGLLMVVAVSALLTLVVNDANSSSSSSISGGLLSSSNDVAKDVANVCYYDYPPVDEDYDDNPVLCKGSEWQPCPPGAVCSSGLLRECADHMMVAETTAAVTAVVDDESSAQKTCVLSTDSVNTIHAMRQLLHEWTVVDVCSKNPYTAARYNGDNDSTDRPLFLYSQLTGELEMGYDWKLIELANTRGGDGDEELFVWEDLPDGNRAIGLHPSQRLMLPGTCSAKLVLRQVLPFLADCLIVWPVKAVFAFLGMSLAVYWDILYEIPLVTLLFTVVIPGLGWIIISWLQNRRMRAEQRRTMQTDRINIRQQVYRLLMVEPLQEHAAVHLRDAILFDPDLPYATATAKHKDQLYKKVWPTVMRDISHDNRIRKATTVVDGVPRQTWYWTAATTTSPAPAVQFQ